MGYADGLSEMPEDFRDEWSGLLAFAAGGAASPKPKAT